MHWTPPRHQSGSIWRWHVAEKVYLLKYACRSGDPDCLCCSHENVLLVVSFKNYSSNLFKRLHTFSRSNKKNACSACLFMCVYLFYTYPTTIHCPYLLHTVAIWKCQQSVNQPITCTLNALWLLFLFRKRILWLSSDCSVSPYIFVFSTMCCFYPLTWQKPVWFVLYFPEIL